MIKLYAAVQSSGSIDFNSINKNASKVYILPSDEKYGNVKVKQIQMKQYREQLPQVKNTYELWEDYNIAWIWSNPDGSYWWDTLSQDKEITREWCSKPELMIALGFKIVPVQFNNCNIAHLIAA